MVLEATSATQGVSPPLFSPGPAVPVPTIRYDYSIYSLY